MKAEELVKALTVEEKISLLSETAPEIERLGIRRYHHGNEALHGVVRPGKFTVFPQAIGMGASFHPELVEEIADAISDEARARHNENHGEMLGGDYDGLYNGLLTFWSPNLNVARDPRWGRTGETYGEDPYLCGLMGTSFVRGLQGKDETYLKTVATPKHFVGNNEEHNRFECNAVIPRDQYFDYYLKPFKMAVKEGKCASVMAAYNAVNGIPCHANKELLNDILRERWGFKGYVVSDCGAVSHLTDRHRFVDTPAKAASAALKAGVDLECGSCGTIQQVYGNYLKQAFDEKFVTEEDIDQAVTRVLKARERLGILEAVDTPYDSLTEAVIGCKKHADLALAMAEESLVLLKNEEGILPLSKGCSIAVIGPHAASCQFGDYSGVPVHTPVSILEGMKEEFPEADILYVPYEKTESLETFQMVSKECLYHYEDGIRKKGIRGHYRSLKDMGERQLRIDRCIDFEWENMAPDPLIQRSNFDILWDGVIVAPMTGSYEFKVITNRNECCDKKAVHCLKIDGKPANLNVFELEEGKEYPVSLEYANAGSHPSVMLQWKCSGGIKNGMFEQELRAAASCDVILACLGLGTEFEAEGRDKTYLSLPEEQTALIKAVSTVNPNIVVTLYNGSSLTIPGICRYAKAVMECWYPGEQGGKAVARILSGKTNPSGRLPLTFYKDVAELPPFDCYDISQGFTYWYAKEEAFPFGYGLSYSEFEYTGLNLDKATTKLSGSVKVRNKGSRAGYETVQIYARFMSEQKEPAKLSWIKKIWLEEAEEKTIEFQICPVALEVYQKETDQTEIRDGVYEVTVRSNAATPLLSGVGYLKNAYGAEGGWHGKDCISE